jgi:hypothetical protein
VPSSPINIDGTVYTPFDCSLYNDVSSYTIDLTSVMTQGGANLYDNLVGAGYFVVINGDPNTLPDDTTGLLNQNLWTSVLFWVGNQDFGTASDKLTVYWPGTFPSPSAILSFDNNLYGSPGDSAFFVQSTGAVTVYAPNAGSPNSHEYDIITPEPGAMLLLGFDLAILMLGGVVLSMRRRARRAA